MEPKRPVNYQKYKYNSSKQLPDEHCEEEGYSDSKLISIPASPHHTGKDHRTQKSAHKIQIALNKTHSQHFKSTYNITKLTIA